MIVYVPRIVGSTLVVALLIACCASPAAAGAHEPVAACDAIADQSVVVVFGDNTTVLPGEEVTVVHGSEFWLVLCQENQPVDSSEWQVIDMEELAVVGNTSTSYYLRMDAVEPPEDPISFESAIENRASVRSPTVRIYNGHLARSTLEDGIRLRFSSERQKESYGEAEEDFSAAERNLSSVPDELENASSPEEVANRAKETNRHLTDLNESLAGLKRLLLASAANGDNEAIGMIRELETRWEESLSVVQEPADERRVVLKTRAADTSRWVLLNFLAPVLPGLVVGGGVAGYYSRRKLDEVEYLRSRTSSVDYSVRQIAFPLVLAAVLLVAAIALLVGVVGFAEVLAVIESLI